MADILEFFQYGVTMRALMASMLVGLMCGVLGCFIVLRNMAMIGDALSHAILPGIVLAFAIFGYSVVGFFAGSVLAGLVTALIITWIQQNVPTKNDAAIGIVFTAMFAIGVIGISQLTKHEGVHLDLKDFLLGNVLGVSKEDLYLTLGITIYVLISVFLFYRYLFSTTFQPVIAKTMGIPVNWVHYFLMLLLSFAVVASIRTVGVILVVAMLITPAATALLISNRLHYVLMISGVIGMISAVVGLLISLWLNWPPGPAMAVVATLFYAVATLFSPNKGLVANYVKKKRYARRVDLEDILKRSLKLDRKEQLSFVALQEKLGMKDVKLKRLLNKLDKDGFVNFSGKKLALTKKGSEEADRMVRAHRLWETYLVNQVGLTEEQIHEAAEKYEHLLPEEIIDEVEKELGYPSTDPHGSPIPSKRSKVKNALWNATVGDILQVSEDQSYDEVNSTLWQNRILPHDKFTILEKEQNGIRLQFDDREIFLDRDIALRLAVLPS